MRSFRPDVNMLASLCETLAEAVDVGMPAGEVFAALAEGEKNPALKALFARMEGAAEEGRSLTDCLSAGGAIPAYMTRMLSVGEATGHGAKTLRRLAAFWHMRARAARAVRSAVIYPVCLAAVLLAVLYVVAGQVLPVFHGVYSQLGATMPGFAEKIFLAGEALRELGWILPAGFAGIAVVVLLTLFLLRKNSDRRPGKVARLQAAADLCAALSMASSAGMDAARGLAFAADLAEGELARRIRHAADRAEAGDSLQEILAETGLFRGMDLRYLSVCVAAGDMEAVMDTLSERYTALVEETLNRRISVIEPVAVLLLSAGVGLLLLGVMLPLLGILSVL